VFRRFLGLAATVLVAAALSGCGNTDSWVQTHAATGWPAQYGDANNSSFTPVEGAGALRLEWSRSVKGQIGAQIAVGSGSYLAVNAQTAGGCSLMVWETDNNGRQRWCNRVVQGGGFASPLFDGFDNVYVGQPGAILSFPVTQWTRWRQPVIGMPATPRILADGQLLVTTHLGQVLIFDAHRGTVEGTPLDLVTGIDPMDSLRGLDDCGPARPGCPVAAAPAFAAASGIIALALWEPDAGAPIMVGLRYHPGQRPLLTRDWTSAVVGGGPLASPVLSADGATVYVNGRDERLWALNAEDGTAKWSVALNYLAQTPPSVSPDGLIIAGGGPGARLTAIRDDGERGDVVWTRDDVEPLTTASRAGEGIAYAVVPSGGPDTPRGQALMAFDPADGHTIDSHELPEATGWPVGVSVGHDRRVVTATSEGQVYGFAPA